MASRGAALKGRKWRTVKQAATNAEAAYGEIKRRILMNQYGPGSVVSVGELAASLGMSRTPLRDALIRLRQERLIDLPPRHGLHVLPISPREMREIYEVLAGLESTAIEILVRKQLPSAELEKLVVAASGMEQALAKEELKNWLAADAAFHKTLFGLAGNQTLIAAAGQFREKISRASLLTLKLRPKPEQSTRSHRELANAIAKGDLAHAREIHWQQRLRSAAELTRILESLNLHNL